MAIFPVLEKRERTRTTSGLDAYNDFWYSIAGTGTKSGVSVNENNAMKYLIVASCVMLIAGDIARLPLILYKRVSDNEKRRVMEHPLYDILHNAPNPEVDAFNWKESGEGQLLLWGDTINEIKRNLYSGDIKYLWQLQNPGAVEVKRDDNGRIFYRWYDRKGQPVVKKKQDVFHIPGFGFNGVRGMSMISIARESIGLGLAAEQFHGMFFGEGTHPSVVVSIPPEVELGDNEKEYKQKLKETLAGLKNAHGIAVFPNGEKAERLTMPLKDAEFMESQKFSATRICGFYHVPPHKVGIHGANSNYNNLEQENQSYVNSCLIHWTARWEQAISHQLLTPEERRDGLFFEFNMNALLKGDSQARSEFYQTLLDRGYPLNRVLAKENENPVEGGDQGFIGLNMIPINKAEDLADSQITPKEEKAIRELREKRSILIRDRISRQYHPLIKHAAEKIVNRESIAIKRQIGKQEKERATSSMADWLNDFYRELPDYIKREIGPVFQSFSRAIAEAAADEIGADLNEQEISRFVSDYINRYSERHVDSSLGQLTSLLEGELSDLEQRVDEWAETRPDKIATNETVRVGSAIFQTVVFAAGLATVWRIRGASTCPYCKELNGKKVRSGESFVNNGDELDPDGGTGPMKIRGIKTHPPLHQGCDCYLGTG